MKQNFLPSWAFNALMKKVSKPVIALALILTISLNSFAHRIDGYTVGCNIPGSNMVINAIVNSAAAGTFYHWQYKVGAGAWTCFNNGVNNINGTNYTVSGASRSGGPADAASTLQINNVTTALENVLVRCIMGAVSDPCTNPGQDIWGGDDEALNETKYLRLHVFASMSICPPNAYACTNNMLVTSGSPARFYGGFENIDIAAGGAYTRNNFGSNASTDYTFQESGVTTKTYSDANNPAAKSATYTRNIAPHSGIFQMIVEGSSTSTTTTDRVWYKTVNVANGSQYRFDVWVARIDATVPSIQLRANTTVLTTFNTTVASIGNWSLVHGVYTATATGPVTFSIRATTLNTNFSLDDICLSLCTSCGALPLHQLSLRSNLQGNTVNLKWIAENEMGTDKFVIERSLDNVNFDEIAVKTPSGPLNTPTEYQLMDNVQSLSGVNVVYYRIRAQDVEGRYAYSNIATVRLSKSAGVQVWPSPFAEFVNISYNAANNTKVDVSVVNGLGNVVKQNSFTVTRGVNQIAMSGLETLSSGIYFIRITDKNTNETFIQKISK